MMVDVVPSNHGDILPPPRFQVIDPYLMRLSMADRVEYCRLVQYLQYSDERNKRNLGLPTFAKHLNIIHKFINKNDGMDAIRGMLCGIHFGVDSMLINTSRMKNLMCRSKSCMNGCFQKLGFLSCRPIQDITSIFSQFISRGDNCILNPRQWCVRRLGPVNSGVTFSPIIKMQFGDDAMSRTSSDSEPLPSFPEVSHACSIPAPLSIEMLLNYKPASPLSIGCEKRTDLF